MAKSRLSVVITGENQAGPAIAQAIGGMDRLERKGLSLGKVLGGIGFGLAAREVIRFAKAQVDMADDVFKTSQKIGVQTEFLSALAYAAKLSDVEFEGLSTGLRFLNKNMAESQAGTKEQVEAFRALGVNVEDAHGKLRPTAQVFLEVAERFARMEDGATKTALAIKIFGRAGADLIPLLNQGKAGLQAMMEEAERLGVVIDTKAGAEAERFNDSLRRLETAAEGVALQFSLGIVENLAGVAEGFSKSAVAGEQFRLAGERLIASVIQWSKHFLGLGFALNSLPTWLRLHAEQALSFPEGEIAQRRIDLQGLADDFQRLIDLAEKAERGPSFGDLFLKPGVEGGATVSEMLANLGLKPKPVPPPHLGEPTSVVIPKATGHDVSDLQDLRSMAEILKEMEQTMLGPKLEGARTQIEKLLGLPGPIPQGWPDQLQQFETQIALVFGKLRIETDKVRAAVERGDIDEITGQQRIIELHRQTGDELAALLPEYERLAALTGDPAIAQGVEALRAETERLQRETNALGRLARETFEDGFANAMASIAARTQTVADAFRNMGRAIVAELTRVIAKMLIVWALQKLIGFVTGGPKKLSAPAVEDPFVEGFAGGGDFRPGQTIQVGEKGPELVRFRRAGTVVPNHRLQTSAGVTVNQYTNIDARGATPGERERLLDALRQVEDRAVARAVVTVSQMGRRGY